MGREPPRFIVMRGRPRSAFFCRSKNFGWLEPRVMSQLRLKAGIPRLLCICRLSTGIDTVDERRVTVNLRAFEGAATRRAGFEVVACAAGWIGR